MHAADACEAALRAARVLASDVVVWRPQELITPDPWETVTDDTYRLAVPGGWLYRVEYEANPPSICFVPAVTE